MAAKLHATIRKSWWGYVEEYLKSWLSISIATQNCHQEILVIASKARPLYSQMTKHQFKSHRKYFPRQAQEDGSIWSKCRERFFTVFRISSLSQNHKFWLHKFDHSLKYLLAWYLCDKHYKAWVLKITTCM